MAESSKWCQAVGTRFNGNCLSFMPFQRLRSWPTTKPMALTHPLPPWTVRMMIMLFASWTCMPQCVCARKDLAFCASTRVIHRPKLTIKPTLRVCLWMYGLYTYERNLSRLLNKYYRENRRGSFNAMPVKSTNSTQNVRFVFSLRLIVMYLSYRDDYMSKNDVFIKQLYCIKLRGFGSIINR